MDQQDADAARGIASRPARATRVSRRSFLLATAAATAAGTGMAGPATARPATAGTATAGTGTAGPGMASPGTAVPSAGGQDPRPPLKHLGVQAGIIRGALTRDLAGTLAQVAAIGYAEIELQWYGGNFGQSPAQLRAALDRAGLRATSALIHAGAMLVGWERHLAAAATIGVEHLAVVNLTEDERQTLADWHEWADRFNRAGEVARKTGQWVALHNEPQFMTPVDGRIPYDEFVARTDPALVALELDVGNMTRAGHDPAAYLRRHARRYRLLHLKDVPPEGQAGDRPLGKGRVDFPRVIAALPSSHEIHAFVEHAVESSSPFDGLRASFDYLAGLRR